MKVLLFNGSPNRNGCTNRALEEIKSSLEKEDIEGEIIQLGTKPIRDCIGCRKCREKGMCIFSDDEINNYVEKAKEADGFVFASPVYFAHPTGVLLSAMDRMFFSGGMNFAHKPAAAVVTARRAGTTASLDAITKHFTISEMPVVSSTYWNMVFMPNQDKSSIDAEGLQTMRNIGKNMAWLIKCINEGKKNGIVIPETEHAIMTNFNK